MAAAALTLLAGCGGSAATPSTLASRPAAEVLADAATALRGASSYHVGGMLDPGLAVDLVVTRHGSTGGITTHGVTWEEVAVGGDTWFRGAALWQATLPAEQAAALGDDWVLVTDPAAAFGFAGPLHDLPARIPDVVFGPHPQLKNRGARRLSGQQVVELSSSRDTYDVLETGTPYPVRWIEVENVGPDGKPCGITLDRFGAATTVEAPVSSKRL